MPLYDCMLLLKPTVRKESVMDLVAQIGKHVYRKNGVLTGMESFGKVQLGYGIRKLDGRYYQGQLMQMTMMAPPSLNNELHYLNKEDRLLRWLLIKHRNVRYGLEFLSEDAERRDLSKFQTNYNDSDIDEDEDDDDEEYDVDQEGRKEDTKT
ncbi:uncharacterized protein LOC132277497 [Cornus florida]|uniref:uncharacterized protein LOC132277497 n=1 Tax=Cornus florida TaxID=4283 RepID=UPI00289BA871|nr:uncharacterized protein LOC132277497 [Cornus florida]